MEADEKTREKIVKTGRTVMAFAIFGAVLNPVITGLYAFSIRPEHKGEHFAIWLVARSLGGVGVCVLGWFVGRGLTRSAEWARKFALWACIFLACYVVGFWVAIVVMYWVRDPILAVFGGVFTAIPVAIFAHVLYACIGWLKSPAVLSVSGQAITTTEECGGEAE